MANEHSISLGITRRILDKLAADIEVGEWAKLVNITSSKYGIHISVPLFLNGDLLKKKTAPNTSTTLLAQESPILDKLLTVACPDNLESVYAITDGDFPSVVSFKATINSGPLYPFLTKFVFKTFNYTISGSLEVNLLEFLRNCPQLEEALIVYYNSRNFIDGDVIGLPNSLRSFTQESPYGQKIPTGLFYRISLPNTCNIAFKLADSIPRRTLQWDRGHFPSDLRGLSKSTMVKITVSAVVVDCIDIVSRFVGATFSGSEQDISLSVHTKNAKKAKTAVKNILEFLKSSGIGLGIKGLCLESLVHGQVEQLQVFLKGVIDIAELRRRETPLEVLVELPKGGKLPDGCVGLTKALMEHFDIMVKVEDPRSDVIGISP